MAHFQIIQGGMGVAVSGWFLARAVSQLGQLGLVSGTALAAVLARRLQLGDPGGDCRRALQSFPFREMADRIVAEYFIEGGKAEKAPFKAIAMPRLVSRRSLVELTVAANFVEVYLAKEGHSGPVGINYLEKIQMPTLPSIYGAMLGKVDYIVMGAGIPRTIPGAMDSFSEGAPASMRVDVSGLVEGESFASVFNPREFCGGTPPKLPRPQFFGIIASATLAMTLARKSNGKVDGFVVEGPPAGGHNAPPRGPLQLSPLGEPVYGPRDVPDLEKIRDLGLPFYLGGAYGRPGKLAEAQSHGAAGIQVGTAFAFCEESGILPEIKRQVLDPNLAVPPRVFTDPLASPTGFPFKVAQLPGTVSEADLYAARPRICDVGYLRQLYRKPDGTLGYRCPAEPVDTFVRKGGAIEETSGRKCICNGLAATVGLGQKRPDSVDELPFVTAGDDLFMIRSFLKPGRDSYTAADVVEKLLSNP